MSKQRSPHWKAYIFLSLGVLTLAFSAIFTRWADAPGSVVSFYRMGIGTLVLTIPFLSRIDLKKRPLPRRGLGLATLAGVFFGFDLAAWATGITYAGATIPTLLGNMAPVWVGLGAWLIFKEKLGPRFWLGLGVAVIGAVFVLNLDLSGAAEFNWGALFGVVSGFFYGSYLLVAQKGRDHLDALSFFWVAALVSSLTLLVLIFILRDPLTGYSTFSWLNFLGLGIFVQGVGWLAINYSQGYLPASLVAPTLLIQPVLTAFLAGPLLGEKFTSGQWLGGAAVVIGIVIVHRSKLMQKLAPETI